MDLSSAETGSAARDRNVNRDAHCSRYFPTFSFHCTQRSARACFRRSGGGGRPCRLVRGTARFASRWACRFLTRQSSPGNKGADWRGLGAFCRVIFASPEVVSSKLAGVDMAGKLAGGYRIRSEPTCLPAVWLAWCHNCWTRLMTTTCSILFRAALRTGPTA